ncbi:hypothetical protein Bca4012_018716 [Brassica carinata]
MGPAAEAENADEEGTADTPANQATKDGLAPGIAEVGKLALGAAKVDKLAPGTAKIIAPYEFCPKNSLEKRRSEGSRAGQATSPKDKGTRAKATSPKGQDDLTEATSPKGEDGLSEVTSPKGEDDQTMVTSPKGEDDPTKVTLPKGEDDPTKVTSPKGEDDPTEVTSPTDEDDLSKVTSPRGEDDPTEVTLPTGEDDLSENAQVQGLTPCCPRTPETTYMRRRAAGFHKRVKRIHDPMKFVVPCKVELPIPPNRSMHLGSYIRILDDPLQAVAPQRWLRYKVTLTEPHRLQCRTTSPQFRSTPITYQCTRSSTFIAEMIDKGKESTKAFTSSVLKLKKVDVDTCFGAISRCLLYHI